MQKQHTVQIFNAATKSVHPAILLKQYLANDKDSVTICGQVFPKSSFDNIYVIGAGKAAAAMAVETEKIMGDNISDGLVTTKYDHILPTKKIKIIEAGHPIPDENCVKAVNRTIALLTKATKNDLVICLVSGGASALWCDVPDGITLQELQTTFNQLINSGAAINEINIVRKHLSYIKGGQLIRHCNGANVFSLIISDVMGDDLSSIASGPTVPDTSTYNLAYNVLVKYNIVDVLPQSILLHLKNGMCGIIAETAKPGEPGFERTLNTIIGNNQIALLAAENEAKALGYDTYKVSGLVTGDAEAEAKKFVMLATAYKRERPVCILQGGETTVKVTGTGKGGRNQHFVLAALIKLSKIKNKNLTDNITILSGGTDGTDGPTDATGGVINSETLSQANLKNMDIEAYLKKQDAYNFLKQTDSLLITGPTQTNIMDIMIAIIK